MRRIFVFTFIAALIFSAASCTQKSDPTSASIKKILDGSDSVNINLRYSGEIYLDKNLTVKFDSVQSDSRCPLNAMCVWAGNGRVKLKFTKDGSSTYKSVNTLLEPRTADFEGFSVQLISLNPYPADAGKLIKQKDYNVDLRIRRTSAEYGAALPVIMTDALESVPMHKDYLSLENSRISGNRLNLSVKYSGGCENHTIELYCLRGILKSNPPQINLYLSHNSNGDACEALITREVVFDLGNLKSYLNSYSGMKGIILLNIYEPGGALSRFSKMEYNY